MSQAGSPSPACSQFDEADRNVGVAGNQQDVRPLDVVVGQCPEPPARPEVVEAGSERMLALEEPHQAQGRGGQLTKRLDPRPVDLERPGRVAGRVAGRPEARAAVKQPEGSAHAVRDVL